MADEADIASRAMEMLEQAAMTRRKPEGPKPNGTCHYCGADVGPGLRYCDVECSAAHREELEIRRRQGTQLRGTHLS